MQIARSKIQDLSELNKIVVASKSFWKYDENYLKTAIPLILITKDWLDKNEGYSIFTDDLAGFMGFEISNLTLKLEHLWIHPSKMKQGLGKSAIKFLLELTRSRGLQRITLLPDPPAEGFYSHLGATFTGTVVQSRVAGGPLFKEMIFNL